MPWGYSNDEHAERWIGANGTREDAIAEGREAYPNDGFWIAEGSTPEPAFFFPDADDIIETAAERAADEIGESSEDWPPDPSKDAKAELSMIIVAWANKHCPCEFWMQDGRKEFVPATPFTSSDHEGEAVSDLVELAWWVFRTPGGDAYVPAATEQRARSVLATHCYQNAPVDAWTLKWTRIMSRQALAKELLTKGVSR